MRILKRSAKPCPRISLILVDWGVRESFHLLHYLRSQTIPRDDFEVIVIEYYSGVSPALKTFEDEVDTWVLLEMPDSCYYHKHLMYNAAIALSKGDIVMCADSDAMVRPVFLETVVRAFDRNPLVVYHMDEFRNVRRDFYPFNYPSFDEVLGDGCINNIGGKTKGILDETDSIHTRNYGACMCARREDVLAIGGADEDLTYLGHICGPYDMTFRLMHLGRRLQWETEEYLYHTWHPGSDGIENHLGPHDGRNMSTTAFQSLCSGRIGPLVENEAIRRLRTGSPPCAVDDLPGVLINPDYARAFDRSRSGVTAKPTVAAPKASKSLFASYHGYDIYRIGESFYGVPEGKGPADPRGGAWLDDDRTIKGQSFNEIREVLDACEAEFLETVGRWNICRVGKRFALIPHELGAVDFRIRSSRKDPRIAWTDSLAEARDVARERLPMPPQAGEAPAGRVPVVSGGQGFVAGPRFCLTPDQRFMEIERRLATVESGLNEIRGSLTWRTLTLAGGILLRAVGFLKRKGPEGITQ